MKKKIVFFLCNIGLNCIANKISPSFASLYCIEKSLDKLKKSAEEATEAFKKLNWQLEITISSRQRGIIPQQIVINEKGVTDNEN